MKRSKKYQNIIKEYSSNQAYSLEEAIKLLPKLSTSKFEGTVEAHIKLTLTDPEQKRGVRGAFSLPNSFGKEKSILVLADGTDVDTAKSAGAKYAGLEEYVKKIQEGWLDFDVVIATPKVMPKIAILGRTLGTKGLMPNPKNGTVSSDVAATVEEYKAGKSTFKSDKQGIVHMGVAKVNMEPEKISENIRVSVKKVLDAAKKTPGAGLGSVFLSPTMGPSVKIDLNDLADKL